MQHQKDHGRRDKECSQTHVQQHIAHVDKRGGMLKEVQQQAVNQQYEIPAHQDCDQASLAPGQPDVSFA